MLRQTRLHHGLRNELKDSVGWSCLDSKEAVGSRMAAPELQQVLPDPQDRLLWQHLRVLLAGRRMCLKVTSDSREDKVRVVHRVHNSLAVPSGFVGFLRSKDHTGTSPISRSAA